jgi:exonuclease III
MLDIISSNAGLLIRNSRIWSIQHFLREQSVNILVIQETHLNNQNVVNFKRIISDVQVIVNNSIQSKHRVTIFCTLNIKVEEINLTGFFNTISELTNLESKRLITIRITTENVAFTMLNVYAFNNAQSHRDLFKTLMTLIRQLNDLYILAGN